MRNNKMKEKLFKKELAKAMIKRSESKIPQEEADLAAAEVSKVLQKAGQDLNMKKIPELAKWIIEQKMKFEDGQLKYDDGVVYDTESNKIYGE